MCDDLLKIPLNEKGPNLKIITLVGSTYSLTAIMQSYHPPSTSIFVHLLFFLRTYEICLAHTTI